MHRHFRRASITALLVASLVPGLAQARTFKVSPRALAVNVERDGSFFSAVWSLLADVLAGRVPGTGVSGFLLKDDNGGQLEPNGLSTATPSTDNGPQLEPNG